MYLQSGFFSLSYIVPANAARDYQIQQQTSCGKVLLESDLESARFSSTLRLEHAVSAILIVNTLNIFFIFGSLYGIFIKASDGKLILSSLFSELFAS